MLRGGGRGLALTMKQAHIYFMVNPIVGTGLDRVLSTEKQVRDRVDELQRARSAARAHQATLDAQAAPSGVQQATTTRSASQEALTGRPSLSPQTANHILQQTQSVDRGNQAAAARQADQAVQTQAVNYSLRNYYLSYVAPGGNVDSFAMRQIYKKLEEGI